MELVLENNYQSPISLKTNKSRVELFLAVKKWINAALDLEGVKMDFINFDEKTVSDAHFLESDKFTNKGILRISVRNQNLSPYVDPDNPSRTLDGANSASTKEGEKDIAFIVLDKQNDEITSLWFGNKESLLKKDIRLLLALSNLILIQSKKIRPDEFSLPQDELFESLFRLLKNRDPQTELHSQRIGNLAVLVGHQIGLTEKQLQTLFQSALLHDIGKIAISDHILFKTGKLTEEEWQVMYQHPHYAAEIITTLGLNQSIADIALHHHEKWNGEGYPNGLKGDQIPIESQIISLVDVWDAIQTDRPYKSAKSSEFALNFILEQSGKMFSPALVEVFDQMIKTGKISIPNHSHK